MKYSGGPEFRAPGVIGNRCAVVVPEIRAEAEGSPGNAPDHPSCCPCYIGRRLEDDRHAFYAEGVRGKGGMAGKQEEEEQAQRSLKTLQ